MVGGRKVVTLWLELSKNWTMKCFLPTRVKRSWWPSRSPFSRTNCFHPLPIRAVAHLARIATGHVCPLGASRVTSSSIRFLWYLAKSDGTGCNKTQCPNTHVKLSTMNMLHTFSTQFSRVDCVVPYSFMSICSGTNILNISHSQFHHATHMQHFIKYTNNFTKCTATLQILLVKLDTRFQIQCNIHINSGR